MALASICLSPRPLLGVLPLNLRTTALKGALRIPTGRVASLALSPRTIEDRVLRHPIAAELHGFTMIYLGFMGVFQLFCYILMGLPRCGSQAKACNRRPGCRTAPSSQPWLRGLQTARPSIFRRESSMIFDDFRMFSTGVTCLYGFSACF